ncbi:MAG TPA: MFS transporter, partial [Phenylobacterium sp.]|nr:MFS transporter [Phenylobacterium sp.]
MPTSSGRAEPAAAPGRRDHIPFHHILALGATSMPLGLIVIVFGVFLPRFYVSLGLSFAAVGAALLIVRLLDVALDLIVGLAMDQTRTPIGRYRPWLLAGAPILMLGVYHLLLPRGPVGQLYLIGWLLAAYLGFSILTLSMAAWGANVAAAYHERARVYGVVQAMSTL